jgi:putative transposase
MTRDPHRGHDALRRGRFSQPGATYFLNLCTEGRHIGLTDSTIAERLFAEAHAMTADATWTLRAATVMPDHIHLLITLGDRLPLHKAVARLKSKSAPVLRTKDSALVWQSGFFDHKLRPDDSVAAVLLYIYLNPYRAQLCESTVTWPGFYCRTEEWSWFKDMLSANLPPPEWLAD